MKTINGDIEGILASLFEEIERLNSELSRLTRLMEKKVSFRREPCRMMPWLDGTVRQAVGIGF